MGEDNLITSMRVERKCYILSRIAQDPVWIFRDSAEEQMDNFLKAGSL